MGRHGLGAGNGRKSESLRYSHCRAACLLSYLLAHDCVVARSYRVAVVAAAFGLIVTLAR
jgi:hypothetical protein